MKLNKAQFEQFVDNYAQHIIEGLDNDSMEVMLFDLLIFDGNHQTNTTKSRLNAILAEHGVQGEHVFQKNFEWFVRTVQGVKAGDAEGFVSVPFFSGMRLN